MKAVDSEANRSQEANTTVARLRLVHRLSLISSPYSSRQPSVVAVRVR